ncbi:release factor glutamine methyltransferase [Clostridium sp. TW13]|uniref:Release factor glutamine methyltransferase n=1 Tax=Inconstantimicrobium mannanitabidum TaxID=1604901 RepID=A0ACB5R745_9CLOT|nr:release factor glutamine methyltransferase [Clostridium sp. TW13]
MSNIITIRELIQLGINELKQVDIETYNLDTYLLLGKVLNKDRVYLIINGDKEVEEQEKKEYIKLLHMRKDRMPMQYILGNVEFMGLDFLVKDGVLIPRGDTEVLVEEVLSEIDEEDDINVLDMCSGSGAIGLSIAYYRKNITVHLVDLYPIPQEVTVENIKRLNLEKRARFIKSDLLSEIKKQHLKYDIIVSNPPYIKEEVIDSLMDDVKNYEPHTALSGGEDGLIFYKRIIEECKEVLIGKRILAFEIGYDQGKDVEQLMYEQGFRNIKIVKDLAGLERTVIGNLPKDY